MLEGVPDVVRERLEIVDGEPFVDDAGLGVKQRAHLEAATIRQPRVGRRREEVLIELVQRERFVGDGQHIPEYSTEVADIDGDASDQLVLNAARELPVPRAVAPPRDSVRVEPGAIYGHKIYVTTNDAHIVALDAQTGDVVWDHTVANWQRGYRYTSGAIVVKGQIVAGITGCERYKEGGCFISAHDPETGAELWRTATIAGPGEPGGDTWGDLPAMFRAGADAWISGSYDPELDRIYWGTAQAKPWARLSRGTDGDALYSNSALALIPETGELDWYYQFIPGESHDLDEAFESVLIDHGGRRSMFKMGKLGILWEIDRATGEFVAAHDLGYQNLVDVDTQTGRVTYRPGMIQQSGVEVEFCPGMFGNRNWPSTAYSPETRALYIPIHPHCSKAIYSEVEKKDGPVGDFYFYQNYEAAGWRPTGGGPHPLSPDHGAHLVAMDIDTGEVRWRHSSATRALASALTTAGGAGHERRR